MAQPHRERKTGGVVLFDTHVPQALPISVDLLPMQDGTGDPSIENKRPIIGQTGSKVAHAGKNLTTWLSSSTTTNKGLTFEASGNHLKVTGTATGINAETTNKQAKTVLLKKDVQYVLRVTGADTSRFKCAFLSVNETSSLITAYNGTPFTPGKDYTLKSVRCRLNSSNGAIINVEYDWSIEVVSEDERQEPFIEDTIYNIEFPALGKNLLQGMETGAINQSTGQNETDANAMRCVGYIPVEPGETYTLGTLASSGNIRFFGYGKDKNYLGNAVVRNVTNATYTVGSETHFIRFQGATERFSGADLQFEKGDAHTEYEPFSNTVYGGTLTINRDGTGVISVFYLEKVLNGSETWQRVSSSTAGASYFRTKIGEFGLVVNGDALCDQFVITPISTSTTGIGINCANSASANAANINIRPGVPWVTSNNALKEWLQENNVQVVYRLSTPIVCNLTELQVIEALQGKNVVYADAGDVTVEFWTN